jgi:N-acetylglucosamine-6-phosphate deacetylase
LENVSIITLAPEKKNAFETISELTKRGKVVSLGHSLADICDGEKAVQKGASMITHLFNAMLPVSEFVLFLCNSEVIKILFI